MFSVLKEGCHVGYSREFVGTVYCTYGQSNTTISTKIYVPGRNGKHHERRADLHQIWLVYRNVGEKCRPNVFRFLCLYMRRYITVGAFFVIRTECFCYITYVFFRIWCHCGFSQTLHSSLSVQKHSWYIVSQNFEKAAARRVHYKVTNNTNGYMDWYKTTSNGYTAKHGTSF